MIVSRRHVKVFVSIGIISLVIGLFQNCAGDQVSFSTAEKPSSEVVKSEDDKSPPNNPVDPPPQLIGVIVQPPTIPPPNPPPVEELPEQVICNPLENDSEVSCELGDGLKGNIHYLNSSLFSNVGNAKLNDYLEYGIQVPEPIVMTQIKVTPRSWTMGFRTGDGEIVQDMSGEPLFEWFSVRLSGYLSLPPGAYKLAMISDDGMQVIIDDQQVLMHDGVHSPTFRCSENILVFGEGERKMIKVNYFQGPREHIAMQLLVHPAENGSCNNYGNNSWENLPDGSLSN